MNTAMWRHVYRRVQQRAASRGPSPFGPLPPLPVEEKVVVRSDDEVRAEYVAARKKAFPIIPPVRIVHPHWFRWPRREDDARMIGDYPAVPADHMQLRDPHGTAWDSPQTRRVPGEALHEDYEALSAWAPDVPSRRWGWPWLLGGPALLIGIFGVLYGLGALFPRNPLPRYALRELPYIDAHLGGRKPHDSMRI